MQAHKRKSQKLSHSSVKLPQLKQPSISRGQSKNKMKLHEDSLQVIHQKARNSYSRSLVKARYERYDKEKARSRAEPTRFKTQGIIGEGDGGSPDNSMTALELDNTLRNFQKNVEESRQEMQNEAMRKKLGNKSSLTSIKTAEESIIQTKKSRLLRKAQKSVDSELFNKIIKIMTKSKTSGCEINLQQIEKTLQHINVVKKIQKFKSETGIGSIDDSLSKEMQSYRNYQKMELKNEDNYTQWRRVSLDPNEKSIQYQESTYENENERLNNLILKTQASLSKYWQNKKLYFQLLQKNEKPPL